MLNLYSISLILMLTMFSCSRPHQEADESVVLRSYRLIDEQRTDEAITLLESELKSDPLNYDYKAVLASAYAHKAGFRIQKLIPLFSIIEKLTKANQYFVKTNSHSGDSDLTEDQKKDLAKKSEVTSRKLSTAVLKISHVFEAFDSIPIFDNQQIVFLNYAISILESFHEKIKPEDTVYKVLLKILKLKFTMNQNVSFDSENTLAALPNCKIDLKQLDSYIQDIGLEVSGILSDVSTVNKDKAEEINKLKLDIEASIDKFKSVANQVDQLDDISSALLKKALFQTDLGALAKCQVDN